MDPYKMSRLTKKEWFTEGLLILRETGAAGLTIENLTSRLGKTKGSFYHHFKNRTIYTEELLSYWEEKKTLEIIELSSKGKNFKERNNLLFKLSDQNHDPELEVAIRAWALRDPLVRSYQKRIDDYRINYLKDMFKFISEDTEKKETMSLIRYCFYIGAQQIIPALTTETYKQLSESLQEMFDKYQKP